MRAQFCRIASRSIAVPTWDEQSNVVNCSENDSDSCEMFVNSPATGQWHYIIIQSLNDVNVTATMTVTLTGNIMLQQIVSYIWRLEFGQNSIFCRLIWHRFVMLVLVCFCIYILRTVLRTYYTSIVIFRFQNVFQPLASLSNLWALQTLQ